MPNIELSAINFSLKVYLSFQLSGKAYERNGFAFRDLESSLACQCGADVIAADADPCYGKQEHCCVRGIRWREKFLKPSLSQGVVDNWDLVTHIRVGVLFINSSDIGKYIFYFAFFLMNSGQLAVLVSYLCPFVFGLFPTSVRN